VCSSQDRPTEWVKFGKEIEENSTQGGFVSLSGDLKQADLF